MAAVARATLLSASEFATEAEPALRNVFCTLDFVGTRVPIPLFTRALPERVILTEFDSFIIGPTEYRALTMAASAVGDTHILYTILTAFDGGRPTWRLPLIGFEEYYTCDSSVPREYQGLALTRTVYSPTGRWGLLCPESFPLLGASRAFMRTYKANDPDWSRGLTSFVGRLQESHREQRIDVAWVQPLLDHMYYDKAPRFLEREA
jgi:hypothetical protein